MRYASIILFAIVLAAPFAMRRALAPHGARTVSTAGAETLVVITPHNQDIRNEFARAFDAWHRHKYGAPVALDLRVPGGTNDIKRLLDTTYRAYRGPDGKLPAHIDTGLDVVWGGGDFTFDSELKPLGILQPIHMEPGLAAEFRAAFPQPTLAGVKLYDATVDKDAGNASTPQWIGVCLSSFGICYNPDVYRSLGVPLPSPDHGWHDLTDPRLAGYVALADPAHSGSAAVAYEVVIQRNMADAEAALFARRPEAKSMPKAALAKDADYQQTIAGGWHKGMSELLKIAANARYFTDSSTMPPMDVSRGEAAAAMAIDFYARVTQESVGSDRIRFIAPVGATAITPDPVAILYGVTGRKLELAQHFVEFLLSTEGQRLWILKPGVPGGPTGRSLRRPPIRPDVYADRAGWADDIDPFRTANGFNQRGEWMTLFSDTRPIWVAAWIDSRDALRDAYATILRVTDPSRRAALIDAMANLPIAMSDVEEIRRRRKELEQTHGDLDAWRAEQQIDWAKRFRQHYQEVAADAR